MLFMNFGKEFSSEQLSTLMDKVTKPVMGWSVTSNPWRHINIAWKRKLCGAIEDIAEQNTGGTIHALQSGHSLAVEN